MATRIKQWPGGKMTKHQNVSETIMSSNTIRATLYLEPALHQALRFKSASVHRSMSEITNDAIREVLREDAEDLAAFAERTGEKSLSYEDFLAQIKADGTI
jgi:hypothetical protein